MYELKRGLTGGTYTLRDGKSFSAMFREVSLVSGEEVKKGYIPILLTKPEGQEVLFGEEIEALEGKTTSLPSLSQSGEDTEATEALITSHTHSNLPFLETLEMISTEDDIRRLF